jgi:O-antigen/teichoic acid export membrane protein
MTSPPTAHNQKPKSRYLGNSVWLMSDSILTNLFSLIVLAIVARVLGPTEYGAYAYVFSLAQLFAVVGQLGLDGLLTRELLNHPEKQSETLGTAGALRFFGYLIGAIACLVYGLVSPEHSNTERWLFVSAFLFILITPGPAILENWFRSRVEARFPAMARMIGTCLGGALKIASVLLGLGVIYVGVAQVATISIILGIMLWLYMRRGGPPLLNWTFSSARARSLLSESWMIFAGSLMAMIYLKIDLVMLRWWAGTEEVGIYAIAARLSEVFYFIPAALVTTLFPRLIELHKSDEDVFSKKFGELLSILALLAFCVMIGVYFLGGWFVGLTFGENYMAAVPILAIHMFSMPFIFMRYAFSRWILVKRFAAFSLMTQSAGAISNVALNVILIPEFGMMGAAVATIVSYACASYLALLLSSKTRGVFIEMTKSLIMPWRAIMTLIALRKKVK